MIDICPTTDCTGCSACFSICPRHAVTLIPDQEGFLHPQIDQDLCIDCDLCRKACPARQTPSRKDRLPEELFLRPITGMKTYAWHPPPEAPFPRWLHGC